MPTQAEKGRAFKERHAKPGIILLPNPWDAGTAKLLQLQRTTLIEKINKYELRASS